MKINERQSTSKGQWGRLAVSRKQTFRDTSEDLKGEASFENDVKGLSDGFTEHRSKASRQEGTTSETAEGNQSTESQASRTINAIIMGVCGQGESEGDLDEAPSILIINIKKGNY